MYAGFFGLRQSPFSIAPDPHYLYMSERHREALAHLLYGVQGGGGFVLLTGEIGAGKTTVCRAFLEQVPDNCRVAYIFNPKLTVGDLLRTICHEFHIEVRHDGTGPATIKDHLDPLNEYLLASHAQGLQNLLIIDEAQALTPQVLEQLRLLTNLETNERKLLQIVLIGQPELRQLLAQPDLEQLAQRVIARYHLGALDERETLDYVQHRLAVAGLQGPLPFEPRALRRIHALTRGVPRRINLLCDRALLGAYARGQRQVTTAIVRQAAAEVFDTPAARAGFGGRDRNALWLGLGALAGLGVAAAVAWTWWPGAAEAPAAAPPLAQPSAPQQPPPALVSAPDSEPVQPALAAVASAMAPPVTSSPPPANQLYRTEALAWRELAGFWGLTLEPGDACEAAQRQQHQCYRTTRMSLHGLQQLDRPAILGLRMSGQPMVMALLTGLSDGHATLQAGGQRWQMPLTALTDIWQGDYATFWQTPPGVAGRISDALRGAAMPWLAQQLSTLQNQGTLDTDAGSTLARLAAFQRRHGIDADGVAGPVTCMLINRATGVEEPRLSTHRSSTPPAHVLHP